MRILVVEDERPIAEFIQRGLEEEGYSVACAFDGEKGLALARSGDVIAFTCSGTISFTSTQAIT